MSLAPEEQTRLAAILDKCDAALTGKPTLASRYNSCWRREFGQEAILPPGNRAGARPEFIIKIDDLHIDIEAKSFSTRRLTHHAKQR